MENGKKNEKKARFVTLKTSTHIFECSWYFLGEFEQKSLSWNFSEIKTFDFNWHTEFTCTELTKSLSSEYGIGKSFDHSFIIIRLFV